MKKRNRGAIALQKWLKCHDMTLWRVCLDLGDTGGQLYRFISGERGSLPLGLLIQTANLTHIPLKQLATAKQWGLVAQIRQLDGRDSAQGQPEATS